ncbi:MAG: uracil-DNA glycosylase [Acidimicrobiia bacterium]
MKSKELVPDDVRTYASYEELKADALTCTRCDLCKTRTNVVFCDGEVKARVMVVGEAPGATEDEMGKPFVGRSGQLLIRLFNEIGIKREDIYIANVLKCRPPDNRDPLPFEIQKCRAFLESQIDFVKPRVIVPVGNLAARFVLDTKEGITKLRGKAFVRGDSAVIPTVHPAFVLRNGIKAQAEMLEDLKNVQQLLEG